MAFTIKNNEKIAVAKELEQGVYINPSNADFILPLADGIELNPAKELLDRDILTPNIGKILPRTGIRSVSGNIGVEAKASETEGAVPEQGSLTEAALGPAKTVAEISLPTQAFLDGATTFTKTTADDIEQNDIVLIKFAGAYHLSPVTDVTNNVVTMLLGVVGAKADAIYTVAAFTNYKAANSGHPSLSITKEVEGDLVEEGIGTRVTTMSLENFTTGQLPTHTYALEGLTYDWVVGGVKIIDSDDFDFNVANATDAEDSVTVSINGSVDFTFAYTTGTPAAGQFNTVAELAALIDTVDGLSTSVDTATITVNSELSENDVYILTFVDGSTGNNPFNKFSITFSAIPSFDTSLPPVVLEACIYQNDVQLQVNELGISVENSLGLISSTCSENGNIASRITARETTGTFNPYKTASVDGDQTEAVTLRQYNLFNDNTPYSLFAFAYNPTATEGEFSQVIAYWLPSCLSTEIPEGDQDDVLQYNISFTGSSGSVGADADIIIAYI